ncbi:hypothetical protein [Micromonospora olivasterospora]|uniref:Dynamin family protein n=1 Tax=Micromonospora olivasterospora TaxID=1880 RepID=A0A562ICF0_MICOL|nr:hypothetical protein [Micromonospora olivasterospora]TWH68671.1 hypothetical protein JD77_03668 [Micromonospora olivasterospora]
MKPGPLPGVDVPDHAGGGPFGPPRCAPLPTRLGLAEPRPDEPLAVVAAGPAGAARRDVLAALLRLAPDMLAVPAGSWLVVDHARAATRAAYVPGYREPHSYAPDGSAAGPALARPPRRVELSVAEPLLRHFTLVDTPDSETLGAAGGQILRDAVGRGGALLFVIAADQAFTAAELHLLAEVARTRVEVCFVVTPGGSGWAPPSDKVPPAGADPAEPEGRVIRGRRGRARQAGASAAGEAGRGPAPASPGSPGAPVDPGSTVDQTEVVVAAHRAALLSAVPGLAGARWYPARPEEIDALRRSLVGWAAEEGLRRSSAQPPVLPGTHGRVSVLPGPDSTEWSEQLDRQARACAQRIREHLALELANIHLRVVQEIVSGVGCAGLPQLLDREMEALALLATDRCDRAVRAILDDAAARVFGAPVADGVRRRIADAVRFGLADHLAGRDLDRVLLVTSTAGVAELTGAGAVDSVSGYPGRRAPRCCRPWPWRSPAGAGSTGVRRATTTRAARAPGRSGRCGRSSWSSPGRFPGGSR